MLDYVVLKVNTTGLDVDKDRITEIALIHMNDNKVVEVFTSLVNPEIEISQTVEKISGINNSMVEDKPSISDLKEKIKSFIGDKPIIGHNVNFDLGFLENEFGEKFNNKVLDTCNISRAVIPFTKVENYRLPTICKKFGIEDNLYERALHNAMLIALLFNKLIPMVKERKKALDE